jgi:hypothetical protein
MTGAASAPNAQGSEARVIACYWGRTPLPLSIKLLFIRAEWDAEVGESAPFPPLLAEGGEEACSTINLASVADAQHADDDSAVLNIADDAPVPHPVFPVSAQLRTRQGFAKFARIVQNDDPLAQKSNQALLYRPVQPLQIAQRLGSNPIS